MSRRTLLSRRKQSKTCCARTVIGGGYLGAGRSVTNALKVAVGSGDGEPGEGLGDGEDGGAGQAGNQPGQHILEVEVSIDELAEIGVTWLTVGPPRGDRAAYCDWARRFGDEVLAQVR